MDGIYTLPRIIAEYNEKMDAANPLLRPTLPNYTIKEVSLDRYEVVPETEAFSNQIGNIRYIRKLQGAIKASICSKSSTYTQMNIEGITSFYRGLCKLSNLNRLWKHSVFPDFDLAEIREVIRKHYVLVVSHNTDQIYTLSDVIIEYNRRMALENPSMLDKTGPIYVISKVATDQYQLLLKSTASCIGDSEYMSTLALEVNCMVISRIYETMSDLDCSNLSSGIARLGRLNSNWKPATHGTLNFWTAQRPIVQYLDSKPY